MSKIPTAEEFLDNIEIWDGIFVHNKSAKKAMIEFAKLHVKVALEEVDMYMYGNDTETTEEVRNKILNSYSLDNIK